MFYKLTYHIQNSQDPYLTPQETEESILHFIHRLCYSLTNGHIRTYAKEINLAITRYDYHGFEVIVLYPDQYIPDRTILATVLQEEEVIFDYHYYDKPVNFENIHLNQISEQEFLMRLSQSDFLLQNIHYHISGFHQEHFDRQEAKYKEALEKLEKQGDVFD